MSDFNQWARLVSLVSIVSGVMLSIVPQSQLKSAFKMLCVSVLIYTIVFPLSSYDLTELDFDSLIYMQQELEEEYERQNERLTLQTSESSLQIVLEQELQESRIDFSQITVTCKYEEENIVVESVIIKGIFSQSEQEIIEQIICYNLGEEVVFELVGE